MAVLWRGRNGVSIRGQGSWLPDLGVAQSVLRIGVPAMRLMALAQPFWGVLFVQAGALRGSGDTAYPLRVSGSLIWLSVGLAAAAATAGGGLTTVWAAFLLASRLIALLMWRRFQRTVKEF